MERELKIGQHLVFIDADRQERDALLISIHGDPKGRWYVWDEDDPDRKGPSHPEMPPDGPHWPCVNLVVVEKNEGAQDQYGRQTKKEGVTSVVHWTDSTAQGFCYRWPDEEVDWSRKQPSIS